MKKIEKFTSLLYEKKSKFFSQSLEKITKFVPLFHEKNNEIRQSVAKNSEYISINSCNSSIGCEKIS